MSAEKQPIACPDCDGTAEVSRRGFVKAIGTAALAGGLIPRIGSARPWQATERPAETAAKRLFESLSDAQKKTICLPFDDPLRTRINANWAITKPTIEEFFNKEQQALVDAVFRGVTSPDGYERFIRQMDDDSGGLDQYHVALFGTPGTGKFEFEMTGRHLTIRADGDSVAGAAFGGPIIYGHGAGDGVKGLPGNVFYYQTQKANEVFKALDGTQREKALVAKAPKEAEVGIQGSSGTFPGINVGELSADQKGLVESVIKVILAPYREADVAEAMDLLKQGGGLDTLRMAFYKEGDLGDDQEWDMWRLEGPNWVSHFRGSPHVHAYINIGKKA